MTTHQETKEREKSLKVQAKTLRQYDVSKIIIPKGKSISFEKVKLKGFTKSI